MAKNETLYKTLLAFSILLLGIILIIYANKNAGCAIHLQTKNYNGWVSGYIEINITRDPFYSSMKFVPTDGNVITCSGIAGSTGVCERNRFGTSLISGVFKKIQNFSIGEITIETVSEKPETDLGVNFIGFVPARNNSRYVLIIMRYRGDCENVMGFMRCTRTTDLSNIYNESYMDFYIFPYYVKYRSPFDRSVEFPENPYCFLKLRIIDGDGKVFDLI